VLLCTDVLIHTHKHMHTNSCFLTHKAIALHLQTMASCLTITCVTLLILLFVL